MLFNSLSFLYLFLPITYLVFWRLTQKRWRYVWLTVTGYVFYSAWNYRFCALMALSTAVAFLAGVGLFRFQDVRRRRLCLIVPLIIDLSLLGFFKYANFFLALLADFCRLVQIPFSFKPLSIVLPVGISFYTFHTITYVVDCYRRTISPTRNLFEFSSYVSLFAQLVAGPIVRFGQIEQDLERIDRADRKTGWALGWWFFALGMIKKVLIADTIASYINPVWAQSGRLSTLSSWLVVLGYSYELYFDFSGYSDMAVGLGQLFGLRLPQNFNSPYKALNPADFWRRWHISLSTVLRDYLYIPLGGNRVGPWRVQFNLLLTMLLGGLWHGANLTFVIWGAYHGMLLILYRQFGQFWNRMPPISRRIGTFFLVTVGWVFFRADNLRAAQRLLVAMFGWQHTALFAGAPRLLGYIIVAAVVAHGLPNTFEQSPAKKPLQIALITVGFVACIGSMYLGNESPFLYFQF